MSKLSLPIGPVCFPHSVSANAHVRDVLKIGRRDTWKDEHMEVCHMQYLSHPATTHEEEQRAGTGKWMECAGIVEGEKAHISTNSTGPTHRHTHHKAQNTMAEACMNFGKEQETKSAGRTQLR